jgi:hypothetical protein
LFLTFVFIALGPVSVHSHGRIDFETVAAIARKSAAEASRAPQRIPEFLTNISWRTTSTAIFDSTRRNHCGAVAATFKCSLSTQACITLTGEGQHHRLLWRACCGIFSSAISL